MYHELPDYVKHIVLSHVTILLSTEPEVLRKLSREMGEMVRERKVDLVPVAHLTTLLNVVATYGETLRDKGE
jgi:hypothetical protein